MIPILEKHFASIILSKENTITSYVIHSCTEAQFEMFLSSVKDDCPSKLYVSNLCFSPEDLIRSSESLTELRQLAFLYPENLVMTEALLGQCNTVSGFKTKDSSSLISALKAGNLRMHGMIGILFFRLLAKTIIVTSFLVFII